MRNKLKIAAAVAVLVVAMVVYKDQFEKREAATRREKARLERQRWN